MSIIKIRHNPSDSMRAFHKNHLLEWAASFLVQHVSMTPVFHIPTKPCELFALHSNKEL